MSAARDFFSITTRLQIRPAGVSQQSVADAMGISRQHLSLLENDNRKIGLELACEWARARGGRLVFVPDEDNEKAAARP